MNGGIIIPNSTPDAITWTNVFGNENGETIMLHLYMFIHIYIFVERERA